MDDTRHEVSSIFFPDQTTEDLETWNAPDNWCGSANERDALHEQADLLRIDIAQVERELGDARALVADLTQRRDALRFFLDALTDQEPASVALGMGDLERMVRP